MFAENKLTEDFGDIRNFLLSEREKTLSEAEWRFRMRGYGYNLKRVDTGYEVARMTTQQVIGTLDL
ncbi:hypothetical protein [Litorisediminicola beolgyonensis]|uniref:Uncharacterized protein n=1 Tax=Litorisediminicola beolgyonensis TaxID=1173614 RepID=A0ABW3ZEB4_9RHOB